MTWNLSTPDWQNRIRTGESLIPDLPFLDKVAAQRAVNVFDRLRLPDVTGKPLLKDAAGDWFREIVRALHGSIVNGERMLPLDRRSAVFRNHRERTRGFSLLIRLCVSCHRWPRTRPQVASRSVPLLRGVSIDVPFRLSAGNGNDGLYGVARDGRQTPADHRLNPKSWCSANRRSFCRSCE
jgi:hypothetical protein